MTTRGAPADFENATFEQLLARLWDMPALEAVSLLRTLREKWPGMPPFVASIFGQPDYVETERAWRTNQGHLFLWSYAQGAVAAQYPFVQVLNPGLSGVNIEVYSLNVSAPGGVPVMANVVWDNGVWPAMGGAILAPVPSNANTGLAALLSKAGLRGGNQGAAPSAVTAITRQVMGNSTEELIAGVDAPMVTLSPGTALVVFHTTVFAGINVEMAWAEVPL